MPPITSKFSPVAVTMTSAGRDVPEARSIPSGVIREIVSVTISAVPALMARYRSPLGIAQTRWSHGWYDGARCVSTGKPAGSLATADLRRIAFIVSGRRRLSW